MSERGSPRRPIGVPIANSTSIRRTVGESVISISGPSYIRPAGRPTKTVVLSLLVPDAEGVDGNTPGADRHLDDQFVTRVAKGSGEGEPERIPFGDVVGFGS